MDKVDYFFDKILGKWEKSTTLFKLIIYVNILYFFVCEYFLGNTFNRLSIINLFILSIIILILVLSWYVTTNRIPINFNGRTKFAILVNTDDEKIDEKIKLIIKESIKNINSRVENAEVILLPLNYKQSDKEIKQFLNTRGFSIETLIWIKLSSGNFLEDKITFEKMSIDEIHCFSKLGIEKSKRIYSTDVCLVPDIKLSNYHKNWDFLDANSKVDKHKYKVNFSDLILHYVSIYFIYLEKFEISLNILLDIKNNNLNIEDINKNKNKYRNARFTRIILELFLNVSMDYYHIKKDYEKCNELLLKALELINEKNPLIFDIYTNIAITSYKLDKLFLAKEYTSKLKILKPLSSIVFLNQGFFGIIENQPLEIARCYSHIKMRYKYFEETNILEVIEFISSEKLKFIGQQNEILFDFCIGFLSRYYADENEGINILSDFIKKYHSNENCCQKLLQMSNEAIQVKRKV
jgi:hypothetical protein